MSNIVKDMPPDIPSTIEDGEYALTTSEEVHLHATSDKQTDTIWFATPVLKSSIISRIHDIQLFTVAHNQGKVNTGKDSIRSWFELVILENPQSRTPRMEDGRVLVWRSHEVPLTSDEEGEQTGILFSRSHELFGHLSGGNVIAVRACRRFAGCELHAHSARLVVRFSDKELVNGTEQTQRAKRTRIGRKRRRQGGRKRRRWGGWNRRARRTQQTQQTKVDGGAVTESTQTIPKTLAGAIPWVRGIRSDREHGSNSEPLQLLSLDGGGVRGISSLYVLKAIMDKVAPRNPNAKPCDYFDMIAGTSTGGLIAIMLGRLRMTVNDCIKVYKKLARDIFNSSKIKKMFLLRMTLARYSASGLEDAVKKIVKQRTGNSDELMEHPNGECRVFVPTCRASNLEDFPTHLRTYTNKNVERPIAGYKIWEAARATTAAPTYFPPMPLGGHEYVDGGLGFNNPVLLLLGEARRYYGFARPIGCLVTIGTGTDPNVVLPNTKDSLSVRLKRYARMWELVTLSENTHRIAKSIGEPGTYFRFNVGEKLAEKRWINKVAPEIFDKWFKGEKKEALKRHTPKNLARLTIALDDCGRMKDLGKLTEKYMETASEVEKTKIIASKLSKRPHVPMPKAESSH